MQQKNVHKTTPPKKLTLTWRDLSKDRNELKVLYMFLCFGYFVSCLVKNINKILQEFSLISIIIALSYLLNVLLLEEMGIHIAVFNALLPSVCVTCLFIGETDLLVFISGSRSWCERQYPCFSYNWKHVV